MPLDPWTGMSPDDVAIIKAGFPAEDIALIEAMRTAALQIEAGELDPYHLPPEFCLVTDPDGLLVAFGLNESLITDLYEWELAGGPNLRPAGSEPQPAGRMTLEQAAAFLAATEAKRRDGITKHVKLKYTTDATEENAAVTTSLPLACVPLPEPSEVGEWAPLSADDAAMLYDQAEEQLRFWTAEAANMPIGIMQLEALDPTALLGPTSGIAANLGPPDRLREIGHEGYNDRGQALGGCHGRIRERVEVKTSAVHRCSRCLHHSGRIDRY